MTAVRVNKLAPMVLTRTNVCVIMDSTNIGKDMEMDGKKEVKEEMLERLRMGLYELTDEQIDQLVLLAREQGIELE